MSTQQTRSRDDSSPAQLSKDTIFSILSNRRRRYVLYYLQDGPGSVSLRDLAERIAAWENDVPVEELEYKQRKRVYTSLHQTHLPKLDEVGVVDYDRDRGTITLADRAADLDDYLTVVGDDDGDWYRLYLGLSVVSLVAAVSAWLGVPPFSRGTGLAVAGLVVILFAVAASVHTYRVHSVRADAPDIAPDGSGER